MSLAACPDCGNDCSLLAQVCPRCGRPFQPGELERILRSEESAISPEPKANAQEALQNVPANNSSAAIGCLVIAVLFILLAIVCMSAGSNKRADCEQERLEENQRRYAQAQRDPNYNPQYVGPCQ